MRNVKDSGIEWVGNIPDYWNVMPNKRVMHKQKEICNKYNGEPILSLTMNGVIIRDLDAGGKIPTTFDGYQIVKPNNLLMCLFDYDVTPRCIGLIKNFGITSPAYSQFVLDNGNCPNYYYYYYLMIDNTKEILHLAKNLRHSFTEEQLGEIYTPVPPIEEQRKIANFLDEKIGEIDNAIEKTKETIEDYKKLKASIIANCVTKGIKKDSKLIDSQINWIGKYPETWVKTKLKKFCKINNGKEIINELSSESEFKIDVFGSGGVFKYTDQELYEGESVLFGRKGTLGKPLYVNQKFWTVDTMYYLTFNDSKLLPKYCYYQLIVFDWNPYITQTALPSIVGSTILNCDFVFPGIKEQKEIVQYLDEKCNEIDKLIESKENIVNELENYKKSVIYEYVTGKKEVK